MQRLQLNVQRPDDTRPRQILAGHFPFRIGRALDNDLSLPSPSISGKHLLVDCADDATIVITDLGSTNGTVLGDERLAPHQPRHLTLPTRLRIGDIHLEIRSPQGDEPGFTMAESATELRAMVDDALRSDSSDESNPFFEILSGPGCGQRFHIEPDGPQLTLGNGADAHLHLRISDAPPEIATIFWRDMHCWLRPQSALLQHRGAPLDGEHRLRSGDRFTIGIVELLYYDPLEDTLASIDPEHWKADEPAASSDDGDDDEESDMDDQFVIADDEDSLHLAKKAEPRTINDESPERLGAIELVLLAMSIFFLVGAIAVMAVFFL